MQIFPSTPTAAVAFTPVKGKNDCQPVSCKIKQKVTGKITMKVNDDQGGGQTAKEFNATNNADSVLTAGCVIP